MTSTLLQFAAPILYLSIPVLIHLIAKARVSCGSKSRLPAEILGLPAEIEAEILLRLPVKTLIRFKSVCKSWYSLISSSHFHQEHFRLAQRHPLLLTLQSDQTNCESDLTLRFSTYNNNKSTPTPLHKFSKTLPHAYDNGSGTGKPFTQSCLGFVCVASWSYESPPILILNPSTEELLSLPPIQHSNVCVGFGYTPSTQLFKVVRFFHGDRKTHCEVFTLGSTHWRAITSVPYLVHRGTAPFLNGAFHFLPRVWFGVQDTDCVGVFDIETEECRQGIPLPASYYGFGDCQDIGIATAGDFMNLTNIGGLLCVTFDFGEMQGRLELWILKDYNNVEWVNRYNIDISSAVPYMKYGLWAYPAENRGDESIVLNLCDQFRVKLLCYDPEDETVMFKIDEEWASTFYVESLYPLREAWSASGNFSPLQGL